MRLAEKAMPEEAMAKEEVAKETAAEWPKVEPGRAVRDHLAHREEFTLRLLKAMSTIARIPRRPNYNHLGGDVDAETLARLEQLFAGALTGGEWDEAQLRELAFWRWVAYEGYDGADPRLFPWHQEQFMTATYMRTGWPLSDLYERTAVEIGCGPLGMINYLPVAMGVGTDPLNPHYSRLFSRYRCAAVRYVAGIDEAAAVAPAYDFGVCHNVIDHSDDPAALFNRFMGLIRPGGRFLFQVNTIRADVPRTEEHRRMHPSPMTLEQVRDWVSSASDDNRWVVSQEPSTDGEFHFLSWGTKLRDPSVSYQRLVS